MLTNLVATMVTFVTNVTESVTRYERYEQRFDPNIQYGGNLGGGGFSSVGVNPLEKTRTFEAVKITTLNFDWLGKQEMIQRLETLWKSNVVLLVERAETWKPVSTNEVKGTSFFFSGSNAITNGGWSVYR